MAHSDKRVILVTGASSGIGRGTALRLGAEGYRVGVGFRSHEDEACAVADQIKEGGGEAVPIGGDVSKEEDVENAFGRLLDTFGRIDGAVINAGVQADSDLKQMSIEAWRKVTSVDLDGAFLTAREALRRMEGQKSSPGVRAKGALVFVTSVHEFIPWAGHANYAAAKGGVQMLMRSLAQEMGCKGIRVNGVAPGAIKTPINEEVWSDEAQRKKLLELIPYGRLGEPEDVAAAVAWLLSDDADYVTGTTLTIDGGMALYPGFLGNG
jgi:glucose 1-dehydrogenase